ncbi:hypothetical protein C0431_06315 [bacterium]|nr:hypothetical protein [bacterium]
MGFIGDVRNWLLCLIAGLAMVGCVAEPPEAPGAVQVDISVGFRNQEALREHWSKHGRQWGKVTMGEYLYLAQELRDTEADGRNVIVGFRNDGVVTKFDRRDGEFIAYNRNKVIRTFFKPDDGERYFSRQMRR